jgi:hypothetical protein
MFVSIGYVLFQGVIPGGFLEITYQGDWFMKLSHALAVLKHAQTLESVGSLSSAMKTQVTLHEKNIAALVVARKAVTSSARRIRELAKVADAVYPAGTFKDVSASKKIPARRKTMADRAAPQPTAS